MGELGRNLKEVVYVKMDAVGKRFTAGCTSELNVPDGMMRVMMSFEELGEILGEVLTSNHLFLICSAEYSSFQ